MSRDKAICLAKESYRSGEFLKLLSEAVRLRTLSQKTKNLSPLNEYINDFLNPLLSSIGFICKSYDNPVEGKSPFLIAERIEDESLPTVLMYGHGDVIYGQDERWSPGLSPWEVIHKDDKLYGRGTADNKGQHIINILALKYVFLARNNQAGFNVKILIEMGEENGSPGINEFCSQYRDLLKSDVFIGSDGPRVASDLPTLYLGSRGVFNFKMNVNIRDSDYHSGNWGGIIRDPGLILSNAISSIADQNGRIKIKQLKPSAIPENVKELLSKIDIKHAQTHNAPRTDDSWGEPELSISEKLYGWNSFSILAFTTGNPQAPAHAISGSASAYCHIRYVADCDPETFIPAIRNKLDEEGFKHVTLHQDHSHFMKATRLNPENHWVRWAVNSMEKTLGQNITLLPNLGGSIPNSAFSDILGLPTLWIPHSYPSCAQHAPDEHLLTSIVEEGLQLMAGIFWDLGDQ